MSIFYSMSQSWLLQHTHNALPPTVSVRLYYLPHLRSWHWRQCPHRSRSCWPPWQLPLHTGYHDWNRGGIRCWPHTETESAWMWVFFFYLFFWMCWPEHVPKLSLDRQLHTAQSQFKTGTDKHIEPESSSSQGNRTGSYAAVQCFSAWSLIYTTTYRCNAVIMVILIKN